MTDMFKNEDASSYRLDGVSQAYNGYNLDEVVKTAAPTQEDGVHFNVGASSLYDSYSDYSSSYDYYSDYSYYSFYDYYGDNSYYNSYDDYSDYSYYNSYDYYSDYSYYSDSDYGYYVGGSAVESEAIDNVQHSDVDAQSGFVKDIADDSNAFYPGENADSFAAIDDAQDWYVNLDGSVDDSVDNSVSFDDAVTGFGDDMLSANDPIQDADSTFYVSAVHDDFSAYWGSNLLSDDGCDSFFYSSDGQTDVSDVVTSYDPWEGVIDVSSLGAGGSFHVSDGVDGSQIWFDNTDLVINLNGYYHSDDMIAYA